jgi:hypothetical protein
MSPRPAGLAVLALALVLLLTPVGAAPATGPGHYVPAAGDRFVYGETITLTNGTGNYSGYSEDSVYTGDIAVTAVLPNGTESASYASSGTFRNTTGSEPWSESGTFTFSAATYHYVTGTDNQTGYTDPFVWFYVNNTVANGSGFTFLNTPMTVASTDATFRYPASSTGYAQAILAEGTGSYQRNDDYGQFTADYTIHAWYSPITGYVLGYVYTEQDSNALGDAFTYTDSLTDTSTTFAVTPAAAPPASGPSASTPFPWTTVVLVVIFLVLIVVFIVMLVRRRSRGPALPRHAAGASVGPMPTYAAPPPIGLIPRDQPAIQQVVIRETVKVPCAFCGTLIDSTARVCPQCGAPRQ